jgi:phosphatidylglycerol:prolipoprotein diacylglycerol transferase
MVFPNAPSYSVSYEWVRNIADQLGIAYTSGSMINLPRHPSQLYEALFEGVLLWLFLWFVIRKRNKFPGYTIGWYLVGYGVVRFFIEYFREPDSSLGFIINWGKQSEPTALFLSFFNISMGQIFCFIMIVAGAALLCFGRWHRRRSRGS